MPILALPLFAVLALAQDPPPTAPPAVPPSALATDLAELARRVEAAHWPRGPVPPVTAVRAELELHLRDKAAESRGQVDIKQLDYFEWERPGGKRPLPLMRYEVLDAGAPVVRGRDRRGPWQLARGAPRDLTGADDAQDRKALEQHVNLVRQMVRCLSPGDMLRALLAPTPVTADVLRVGRQPEVPCQVVGGRLDAFPLLQQGGEDAPVQVQVWVEQATGRLLALDVWPLRDGVRDEAHGERVLLGDLREDQGLLVPHVVQHYFRDASGQLQLKLRTVLQKLSVRPELRVEDFDRR